jgi:nitrite reductase (NADH) small subunit
MLPHFTEPELPPEWHEIGLATELERTGRLIARVEGREIGILRVGNKLHAIRNRCPHHGGPLCLGTVREREAGTPGRYSQSGHMVLRCPWHGWEFDLETGACPEDASLRVATYDVRVVGERVHVLA